MSHKPKKADFEDSFALHQHYIDILNCMPNIVYWVDNDCVLKGCNQNFIKLMGLKQLKDFKGTPYLQMAKFAGWPEKRIEALKLDDMKVIFSGESQWDVEEAPIINKHQEPIYFRSRRVAILGKDKKVIGLTVVLTDITDQKNLEKQINHMHSETKPEPVATRIIAEPNILMVEDNVIAQKVEEALLLSLHCHVDIAESGSKALTLFSPGKYDMVFMDIGLEDTSGYSVAKKMRQLEQNTDHHVPIIALTSYQADVVKYDCYDYSMDGVLTKPLTSEQAEQLIKHFILHENVPVTGLKSGN